MATSPDNPASSGTAMATILAVDDSRINLKGVSRMLEGHFRVLTAESGPAALQIAAAEPRPDLILLDVMMPDMDGYEVIQRLQADEATRERLKQAAQSLDRTPHWLIKQAIFNYLEQVEGGLTPAEHSGLAAAAGEEALENLGEQALQVFLDFAESILPQSVLRAAITGAYRRPETEALPMLLEQARLPQDQAEATQKMALGIAEKLRNQKSAGGRQGLVQGLLQEFSLSSQEGVALMHK